MLILRRWSLAVLLVLTAVLGANPAQAASNGDVYFTGTGSSGPTCADGSLDMRITWTGVVADLGTSDWIAVVSVDGAGVPLDISYFGVPVGARIPTNNFASLNAYDTITTRPVIVTLYDVPNPAPIASVYGPNSPQSYAFATSKPRLDQDVIDPATVLPECASLPGAVPTRLLPADGSNTTNTRPLFKWQSLWGATAYEVQIGDTNPPSSTIVSANLLSYTPPYPLLIAPNFWRVRAVYGTAYVSDWSTVWSIAIASPLNAAPTRYQFADNTPTLRWELITWAAAYEIQVDNLVTFGSPDDSSNTIPGNTPEFTTISLDDGTYYWHVRAQRADGSWGVWSLTDNFTVNAP